MELIWQIDQPFWQHIEPERLEQAFQPALPLLDKLALPPAAHIVTVVVTGSDPIRQLNQQYLGIDAPTDVLSFENVADPDFPNLDPAEAAHLGEVIIAYPIAEAQALAAGHTPLEEVILLAVHGMLHLLGFDHDTPENKQAMWAAQRQIMAELGLVHIQPTET
jgi:probable rRNA maturation factor